MNEKHRQRTHERTARASARLEDGAGGAEGRLEGRWGGLLFREVQLLRQRAVRLQGPLHPNGATSEKPLSEKLLHFPLELGIGGCREDSWGSGGEGGCIAATYLRCAWHLGGQLGDLRGLSVIQYKAFRIDQVGACAKFTLGLVIGQALLAVTIVLL